MTNQKYLASKSWFVCVASTTMGPLSTEEVESFLAVSPNTMVWWRGMRYWVTPDEWYSMRDFVIANEAEVYFLDHERHIPRTLEEVVELVKPAGAYLSQIMLWSPKESRSKSVYEDKTICEALGLQHRQNVRAQANGLVVLKKGNVEYICEINTVSSSGLGATLMHNVEVSGEVTVFFKSSEIGDIAPIKAKIIYKHDRELGIKFEVMNAEAASYIISYIKRKTGQVYTNQEAA